MAGDTAGLALGPKAYHYTRSANAAGIMAMGLRAVSGVVYATPRGDLSPLQAQLDLALPPNRGLPDAVFEIDLVGLQQSGVQVSGPQPVGRAFSMPGGGEEILIHGSVEPRFLTKVR